MARTKISKETVQRLISNSAQWEREVRYPRNEAPRRFSPGGSSVKLAKAMPESGDTWPTLSEWLADRQLIFRFNLGKPTYLGDIDSQPSVMGWTNGNKFVEVLNSRSDYIRENSYHLIWKANGKWWASATMADSDLHKLTGTLGEPLTNQSTSTMGWSSQAIPIRDEGIIPSTYRLPTTTVVRVSWDGSNYVLDDWNGCGQLIEEEDEEEEEEE